MAFVDDPNSGQNSQQVAGSTPLSGGQAGTSQEASQGSTGASGSSPMAESGESSQAPKSPSRGSGKASSGMYTNIQKYVAKNQPQAQEMAGAVTQNVERKAQDINQVAQQKKAEQQKLIDTNQQMMQSQQQEAQNLVNQAMTGGEIGQTDQQRFQALMQGPVGVQQVGNLNLASQQNRANALQQLAQSGRTEQGRRNLLKDTFQKQGDYTQGMSGLDQLILGGNQAARENLIQGTAGTADQLNKSLQQLATQGQEAAAGMGQQINEFGGQIAGLGQEAQQGINTQIDQAYQQELDRRKALFGEDSPEYQQALAAAQSRIDQLSGVLGNVGSFADYARQFATNRKWDDSGVNNYLDQMNELQNTGKITVMRQTGTEKDFWGNETPIMSPVDITGAEAEQYLAQGGSMGISHNKDREEIRAIVDALNKNLIGTDELGLYGLTNQAVSSGSGYTPTKNAYQAGNIWNAFQNYKNQLAGLGSAQDVVQNRLSQLAGGQSFADLASGADIQREDLISAEQMNKINALKGLLGQQDILTQEQLGDQAYTSYGDLQNLLKAYGG